MSRCRLLLSSGLAVALLFASSTQALAAAAWTVLSIRVEGDSAQWLDLVKQANALRTRLALPTANVVQATFAGDATGLYFVSTEYPSLAALGEASDRVNADASWPPLLKQLQAASRVESSSLYVDRTPAGVKATPMTAGGYATGMIVRPGADPSAYLALFPRLTAARARLGVAVPRIWQATSAGTGTGAILITTAAASMAEIEESQTKTENDPESQKLLKEFEATGRKVVARLIVRDRTPR